MFGRHDGGDGANTPGLGPGAVEGPRSRQKLRPPAIRGALGAAKEAYRGRVPARYGDGAAFRAGFDEALAKVLAPHQAVLDVGSGRTPTIPLGVRLPGCRYVGLDISHGELERAPAGSYDEMIVTDTVEYVPTLEEQFDVVVSFQVLEHVRPLDQAFDNLRRYLRPGGQLVAQMSGTFSIFGLLNRVIPQDAALWLLRRFLHRDPETVFPAHYHRCYFTALERILEPWHHAEIIPRFIGEPYLHPWPPLRAVFIAYEEWAVQRDCRNLASYYVVRATR
ncbi:MAG: class I SAM-dependent methyltransferase [Actinobacteria bacterium]|nr:class I SAM-dependent methyltransferase [Actinomycetota bacterium]